MEKLKIKTEEEVEYEMDKEFREKIFEFLRWIETYPAPLDIRARVFLKGMAFMLFKIRQISELKGQKCFYEHILNFAKNFEEIYEAKMKGENYNDIIEKYVMGIRKDPSYL